MNGIKAIETKYKGYRFRSRLEARWGVFFDTLGVKWEYEPEGFDLTESAQSLIEARNRAELMSVLGLSFEDGKHDYEDYALSMWDEKEIEWLENQTSGGKKLFYLPDFYLPSIGRYIEIKPYMGEGFWGNPEHGATKLLHGLLVHGAPGERDEYEVCTFEDIPYWFGYCPACKTFGYGFCAWAERICRDHEKCGHYQKQGLDKSAPFIRAINAARSARFEHGENGEYHG